ncbi:hypothetical protein DID75_05940, partial [Candidatus Marinamargulisbacteria bacterium SCGC AG-410-N11]
MYNKTKKSERLYVLWTIHWYSIHHRIILGGITLESLCRSLYLKKYNIGFSLLELNIVLSIAAIALLCCIPLIVNPISENIH